MKQALVPDPLERPLLTIEEAAQILGVCRATGYNLATRGDLPTVKVGRRNMKVPTARLLREVLGIDPETVGR